MNSIELLAMQSTTLNFLSVTLCAAVAGAGSMILYRWVSPQKKLVKLKQALQDSQKRMSGYDGEFDGLWNLIKENLQLAMKRVGWSLGPSLLAGLPMIALFITLDLRHNNFLDQTINNSQVNTFSSPASMEVADGNEPVFVPLRPAGPVIPTVTTMEYLPIGPSWMRSWIFLFILTSTISALVVKFKQGAI